MYSAMITLTILVKRVQTTSLSRTTIGSFILGWTNTKVRDKTTLLFLNFALQTFITERAPTQDKSILAICQSGCFSVKSCSAKALIGTWRTFTPDSICPNATRCRGVTPSGASTAWLSLLKRAHMADLAPPLATKGSTIQTGKTWTSNLLSWRRTPTFFNSRSSRQTAHMKTNVLDHMINPLKVNPQN